MGKYLKTYKDANPYKIQTAKHFIELLYKVLYKDKGKASGKTIYQYWRRFFLMWVRKTGNEIPRQVKAIVENVHYIYYYVFFYCLIYNFSYC